MPTSTSGSSEEAAMDTARNEAGEAQHGQYLGFFSGDEEYAISVLQVKEILQFEAITRVPGTPASIRGVINMRGSVVPVVDLAVKLGLPESEVSPRTCIVIVESDIDGEPAVMGMMADSVSQVIDLRPDEIQPPPPFGTRVHVDYLRGMASSGRKFILLLDIDRILSASEAEATARLRAPVTAAEDRTDPEPPSVSTPEGAGPA
jgi:purine-binding chemotaxis protein CheW